MDDARRLVHRRCPEWSDHNISDPGITLIETFAMMVDQLIYRLNRVPDRNYVKFLELLGLEMRPPGAAQGEATFWLSAPQPQTVTVRAETEVGTDRTDIEEPIVFSTTEKLDIVPCSLDSAASPPCRPRGTPRTGQRARRSGLRVLLHAAHARRCAADRPDQRGAVLRGAAPGGLPGVGCRGRPEQSSLHWEAWTGGPDWAPCDVERDETGVQPARGRRRARAPDTSWDAESCRESAQGWLRCRLVRPSPGQPTYRDHP